MNTQLQNIEFEQARLNREYEILIAQLKKSKNDWRGIKLNTLRHSAGLKCLKAIHLFRAPQERWELWNIGVILLLPMCLSLLLFIIFTLFSTSSAAFGFSMIGLVAIPFVAFLLYFPNSRALRNHVLDLESLLRHCAARRTQISQSLEALKAELSNNISQRSSLQIAHQSELEQIHQEHQRALQVQRRHELLNSDWRSLRGIPFEEFLKEVFLILGAIVYDTPKSGDQGADLIVEIRGIRFVVQVKGYEGSVGNKSVQEAVAAVRFYQGQRAVVITNSYFTKAAKELAQVNDCILIAGSEMSDLIFGKIF